MINNIYGANVIVSLSLFLMHKTRARSVSTGEVLGSWRIQLHTWNPWATFGKL